MQGEHGDRIIPQIENLILEAYNPLVVLRFIALQCMVIGGFKNTTIGAYERLFIQVLRLHLHHLLFNPWISHMQTMKGIS